MIDRKSAKTIFESARLPASTDDALVTVAVSLYNYESVIEQCLDSIVGQTHKRLELIVVDDVSTDYSVDVAAGWLKLHAGRFERALLLQHEKNKGLSAARNLAFNVSAAEFVFVLDADNVLYERAIGRLLEVLEDSGAAVAYSQLVLFDHAKGLGEANIWRREGFEQDNFVDAMALVSKAAWAEVGGYTDIDYGWEDYDFWCKFIEADLRGVYVPELLCRYRVHHSSMRLTDTTAERSRLIHGMMAVHPWLCLS